jgi:hypothetical protein
MAFGVWRDFDQLFSNVSTLRPGTVTHYDALLPHRHVLHPYRLGVAGVAGVVGEGRGGRGGGRLLGALDMGRKLLGWGVMPFVHGHHRSHVRRPRGGRAARPPPLPTEAPTEALLLPRPCPLFPPGAAELRPLS